MNRNRKAFTLTELLVVIVILGMLMAILLPAASHVIVRAKNAVVRGELSSLEAAIAAFRSAYGINPPSGIWLCENASDWQTQVNSKYILVRMWPQYDFTADVDINRNGIIDPPVQLNGAECLVFFLGGTFENNKSPSGFSKNNIKPFAPSTNKSGSLFEFNVGRLVDLNKNGYKEYTDGLGTMPCDPIVYYSAYEGAGYSKNDFYFSELNNLSTSDQAMTKLYKTTVKAGTFIPYCMTSEPPAAFKLNSYQLVAPGYDGVLGDGGLYDPQQQSSLTTNRPTDPKATDYMGKAEKDNLTNFVGGTLAQ